MIEKNAQEIEKIKTLEYLETLNEEMKEKLIGLCLDKKIMESLDSYDENEDSDNEEEEFESI